MTRADPPVSISLLNGVSMITLCSASTANALSHRMVGELRRAVADAERSSVAAIVLRSSLRTFSSGFDLKNLDQQSDVTLGQRFLEIQRLLDDITSAPFLSFALVDGPAVGAGADLVAACDVRVGTRNARFRFPGSQFGIALGLRRLLQVVREPNALELLGGCWVDADLAEQWTLLTHRHDALTDAEGRIASLLRDIGRIDATALRLFIEAMRERHRSGLTYLSASLTPGLDARLINFASARAHGSLRLSSALESPNVDDVGYQSPTR